MGLYLAKRITRPVQMLATAAKEIGAGHLDHRVVPETTDEFGSLIEAFNRMAGELAASRRRLERSAVELEKKHLDVEGRRRYVETILDRIATGVVSVDAAGRIRTVNSAAARLLGLDARRRRPAGVGRVRRPPSSSRWRRSSTRRRAAATTRGRRKSPITRGGRELHLAVMTTPLRREDGVSEGVVLVFDDVTPLIRAQKVAAWREVARRLAHEIKNPLTPIQLCAERMRRHFSGAPEPDARAGRGVHDDDRRRGRVAEGAGGRVLAVRAHAGAARDRHRPARAARRRARRSTTGIFTGRRDPSRASPPSLPKVSVDPEQIRRVIINLVDNAIEAMDQRGTIEIETQHEPANNLVRVVVADDGPGIPAAERDKLFLPYYSTKQRGSGLGLAIVRRIVAEHGGSIDVTDNVPRGTRFAIELPA